MKPDKYIVLLSRILAERITVDRKLLHNTTNKRDIYLLLLNVRIVDLVKSTVALYHAESIPAIAIIFRSIIEAGIDFENLLNDEKYIQDLDYRYFQEWDKIFESTQRGNPILASLNTFEAAAELKELISKGYTQLKENGYKNLLIKDRFDKAKELSSYYSVYNIACCESHNNLRSLFGWYAKLNNDNSYSVDYYSGDKESLKAYFDSITAILINTTIKVMSYFKIDVEGEFTSFAAELESLRESS